MHVGVQGDGCWSELHVRKPLAAKLVKSGTVELIRDCATYLQSSADAAKKLAFSEQNLVGDRVGPCRGEMRTAEIHIEAGSRIDFERAQIENAVAKGF